MFLTHEKYLKLCDELPGNYWKEGKNYRWKYIEYVIIYSCNRNDISNTPHIKFRVFLSWIIQNRPEWKLKNIIENKYPYDRNNPNNTSWSDFYFFERIN